MILYTLAAIILFATMLVAPVALAVLGVRQFRWWNKSHPQAHLSERRRLMH
jgi:hypothetical protein